MREQNPAITLYQHYRSHIAWRGEYRVIKLRKDFNDKAVQAEAGALKFSSQEIEDMMFQSTRHVRHGAVPLNYRMSLEVPALSNAHLGERLFNDLDDWEPVIMLTIRYGRGKKSLFTIWPDGKFHFEEPPAKWYQAMPDFVTFLRTSYVAGRRVWLVRDPSMGEADHPWVWVKERDWTNPVPYVRNHDLIEGVFYRIIPAENGHWKFEGVDSEVTVHHKVLLDEGYRAAERRYDRYRQAVEKIETAERKRTMIAMYVPRHGLVTGDDAVNRFAQSMRVYEPS